MARGGRRLAVARLLGPDVVDESEALARIGPDHGLPVAVVAHRLAGGIDAARQRRLRDDPPVPDRCDQVVLGHHPVAVLHEIEQQVENLRLDRDRLGAAPQLSSGLVEAELAKRKPHGDLLRRHRQRGPHAIIKPASGQIKQVSTSLRPGLRHPVPVPQQGPRMSAKPRGCCDTAAGSRSPTMRRARARNSA
jgi:hypothetical protein